MFYLYWWSIPTKVMLRRQTIPGSIKSAMRVWKCWLPRYTYFLHRYRLCEAFSRVDRSGSCWTYHEESMPKMEPTIRWSFARVWGSHFSPNSGPKRPSSSGGIGVRIWAEGRSKSVAGIACIQDSRIERKEVAGDCIKLGGMERFRVVKWWLHHVHKLIEESEDSMHIHLWTPRWYGGTW